MGHKCSLKSYIAAERKDLQLRSDLHLGIISLSLKMLLLITPSALSG